MTNKQVLMIAGPNGAGKTTTAMTLLPTFLGIYEFVNADEIAHGLNPLNAEGQAIAAGRIMLQRMNQLARDGKNFGFESTGSGLSYLKTLKTCKHLGYQTTLAFLWLPSAEMAVRRVEYRVKSGGHAIPPDTIRRRYTKGLYNLTRYYLPLVDRAVIYDNSQTEGLHLIAEKYPNRAELMIHEDRIWQRILEVSHEA